MAEIHNLKMISALGDFGIADEIHLTNFHIIIQSHTVHILDGE